MASHVNGAGRLFGGQLMEWIDVTGAVAARRHARHDVTLAAVDALEFIAPIGMNDTVLLSARITWTGKTSLEVRVDTFVEHLSGDRQLANQAYLVFVAIDPKGRPVTIQPWTPESLADKQEWQAAQERRTRRLRQRKLREADTGR